MAACRASQHGLNTPSVANGLDLPATALNRADLLQTMGLYPDPFPSGDHEIPGMEFAGRVVEVGTLGGYSGLWMVRGLPPHGRLITIEREPKHAEFALRRFEDAGVAEFDAKKQQIDKEAKAKDEADGYVGELTEAGDVILKAIDEVAQQHAAGLIEPWPEDEDVHTFLERVLTQKLGPLGGKIRAGRSRNDQAANDLKLFLRQIGRAHV